MSVFLNWLDIELLKTTNLFPQWFWQRQYPQRLIDNLQIFHVAVSDAAFDQFDVFVEEGEVCRPQ